MKQQFAEKTEQQINPTETKLTAVVEENTENQNFFGEFLSHIKIFELAGHGLQHDIYVSENGNTKISKYFE